MSLAIAMCIAHIPTLVFMLTEVRYQNMKSRDPRRKNIKH
jgi:hypothetical protein